MYLAFFTIQKPLPIKLALLNERHSLDSASDNAHERTINMKQISCNDAYASIYCEPWPRIFVAKDQDQVCMRSILLSFLAAQVLVPFATSYTTKCVEAEPRWPKTCFVDPWPEMVICPNHYWLGTHEHITKTQLEEIVADSLHPPTCDFKNHKGPLRCDFSILKRKTSSGKEYDFTKIWTSQTMDKEGTPVHTFGGVYWLKVSTYLHHPIKRSLIGKRILWTPTVKRCGVSDVIMTRKNAQNIRCRDATGTYM